MKKVLISFLILFVIFASQNFAQAKKVVITSEGVNVSSSFENVFESKPQKIASTTEVINKKTNLKEKTKKVKEKTGKTLKNTAKKTSEKLENATKTIEEEIEDAKREMDVEADKQPDDSVHNVDFKVDSKKELKEQSQTAISPEHSQIFNYNDENMEVLGKTFWGRKPIHPIGKYGYKGRLPKFADEFEYKKAKDNYKCLIKSNPNAAEKDLIPAPRNEKAYVDIVVKKGSSSQYVNDVNDVIFILQKLIFNMENGVNVQKFNAQVSNLLDNIFYIQDKYKNKPESNYISFYKMLELATVARDTAILRTEAQAYAKYLAYAGEGAVYKPERVQAQMDYFLQEINKTLAVLKAVN